MLWRNIKQGEELNFTGTLFCPVISWPLHQRQSQWLFWIVSKPWTRNGGLIHILLLLTLNPTHCVVHAVNKDTNNLLISKSIERFSISFWLDSSVAVEVALHFLGELSCPWDISGHSWFPLESPLGLGAQSLCCSVVEPEKVGPTTLFFSSLTCSPWYILCLFHTPPHTPASLPTSSDWKSVSPAELLLPNCRLVSPTA